MTADVELLPLPESDEDVPLTGVWNGSPRSGSVPCWFRESVEAAIRANVAHATAAQDAEIEALRAEVEKIQALRKHHRARHKSYKRRHADAEARAERLAEALRGLKDLMLERVKWEPCDCGCPQQRTPDGPHSVTWLRAAQKVEIAISKAEDRG